MATAEHIPGSILSSVVAHEKSLLGKLQTARDAARATVERAKADALNTIQAEETKLAEESAAMRRKAEAARNQAFQETVQAAEQKLVGVRQKAQERTPAVTDNVLKLFVPKGAGEWKS